MVAGYLWSDLSDGQDTEQLAGRIQADAGLVKNIQTMVNESESFEKLVSKITNSNSVVKAVKAMGQEKHE